LRGGFTKEAAVLNDDPRKIWQNQPKETLAMTLKLIRMKVRDLRAQTRKKLLGTLAGPLVVGGFSAYGIKLVHGVFPVLELVFVFAIAWSLAGVYFLNRGLWTAAMLGDAALSTGLEFYRREIERRRALGGRVLLWSFGPIFLAIAAFVLFVALVSGARIFPNGMPFLTLIVIWMVAYFVVRMRERRDLQREIDELNEIEKM
jgi:hypothetical protein